MGLALIDGYAQRAVGYWDFSSTHASGNFTRRSHRSLSCQEPDQDLVVRDANVADLRGLLGAAVLRGPKCRLGTDWESSNGNTLGLRNFIMSNGVYEALQFDGALNDVSAAPLMILRSAHMALNR
jgi:hypothetical protein